jgi:nucleotide-binding universal stress UspA family protein
VAERIGAIARERGADLIVLSTHGRGGVGRWIYGSVADDVLRHAEMPVLVTSAAAERLWAEGSPLRVLVPLDGSPLAEEALARLGELPAALRGELILARVVEVPETAYAMYAGAYLGYDPQPELEAAERYLHEQAAAPRAAGWGLSTYAEIGHPASLLASLARERGVDLVVMATHGRGGLARLALGSVATELLHRSVAPLLLVRPAASRAAAGAEAGAAPVTITLSPDDLRLVERALDDLAGIPELEPSLAEPARALLERLKRTAHVAADEPASEPRVG